MFHFVVSSNSRKPAVCAISSLGYDHMEILGETLEKISWQKSGIFKPDCPAFTSSQFPSPMQILAERASELGVRDEKRGGRREGREGRGRGWAIGGGGGARGGEEGGEARGDIKDFFSWG